MITRTLEVEEVYVLSRGEQREFLASHDGRTRLGRRSGALAALLLGGGLRVGEAVRLRLAEVETGPQGSLAVLVRTLKRQGHRRRVFLFPPYVGLLKRYLREAKGFWLFPGRQGEHLSVRAAQETLKPSLKGRLHALRHTAATDCLRGSGGDVWLTASMLGHSDTRQVMRVYGHYLTADAIRAARARTQAST